MNGAPYIPAWLDDARLTPIQFRVLCHLHRRSGKKMRCWPGAPSIAKACRISEDSLWPAVKALEQLGLLHREKRRYNSNEYVLTVPDVTPSNPVTLSPPKTGERSLESAGCESSPRTGEQSLESRGRKVSPDEITEEKERNEVCGGTHTLVDLKSRFPGLDIDAEHAACRAKYPRAGLKFFAEQWLPRAETPMPSATGKPAAIGLPEPKDWRDVLEHYYGADAPIFGMQWNQLDRTQQQSISNDYRANRPRDYRPSFADDTPSKKPDRINIKTSDYSKYVGPPNEDGVPFG